jgi:hypothetical protein
LWTPIQSPNLPKRAPKRAGYCVRWGQPELMTGFGPR